jgi:Spy/CpxP family protein refolding chaperone
MTTRIFHIGLLGLVVLAGAGTYMVRRNLGTPAPAPADCTRHWLGLSADQGDQIRQDDPGFQREAQDLARTLHDRQQTMIDQVANAATPAGEIRTQAQAVLDAHHALMRRIVQHLLAVRRHVDIHQCTLLNHLSANVMRSPASQEPAGRYGWRGGRGRSGGGAGRGPGGRGGPPWAQGGGRSQGPGRHRYGRVGSTLGLTSAQQARAAATDPNYESEAAELTGQVRDAHGQLAEALEDPNTSDDAVRQKLEAFIALRTQLELRTVDYVLSIRPFLNTEQQQRLIGLSQRGRRWHGGRP